MRHIFIDESGVHKKDGVSSVVLVYVCVDDLEALNAAVIGIEHKLGIESFRWSHSAWEVRAKFIKAIERFDFSLKVAVFKNPFKESIDYERALEYLITDKDISSITIDGKKSDLYERRIKKALGSKGISIRKLKTANDKGYPVLRIADVCAGIIRYHEDHPDNSKIIRLYRSISRKILDIFEE